MNVDVSTVVRTLACFAKIAAWFSSISTCTCNNLSITRWQAENLVFPIENIALKKFVPYSLFLWCTGLLFPVFGQDGFIRYTNHLSYGYKIRILPAENQGWAVYEPDSQKLFRFNSCGRIDWARHYKIPFANYTGFDCFINTRAGGFAFFWSADGPGGTHPQITVVDQSGNVLWSKAFTDPEYYFTTYSIGQDRAGNFFVFSNASKIGGGPVFLTFIKISENGHQLWTRFYTPGGIWGGALTTEDDGYLMRSGPNLLKIDGNGQLQWSKQVFSGSGNYTTPLETEDGFLLAGVSKNTFRTAYYKLNKDGTSALPGCKSFQESISGFGITPFLRKSTAGRIACLANVNSLPTLIEFDGNMDVIGSHSIHFNHMPNIQVTGMDTRFWDLDRMLVAGTVSTGDFALRPQLFAGISNDRLAFGCDSTISIVTIPDLGSVLPLTATTVLHPVVEEFKTVLSENISEQTYLLCGKADEILAVQIIGDSVVCDSSAPGMLTTKTAPGFDTFLWSTGSTETKITVSEPGKYWVQAYHACRQETASDTFMVGGRQIPEIPWSERLSLCETDSFRLNAFVPGASYQWQNGSTQPELKATAPGLYAVDILLNGCGKRLQTEVENCEVLEIPNLFTPDGNRFNERFVAGKMKGISTLHLSIFNRWGLQIHETEDFDKIGWDGKNAVAGVYFWVLDYTNFKGEQRTRSGFVQKL